MPLTKSTFSSSYKTCTYIQVFLLYIVIYKFNSIVDKLVTFMFCFMHPTPDIDSFLTKDIMNHRHTLVQSFQWDGI